MRIMHDSFLKFFLTKLQKAIFMCEAIHKLLFMCQSKKLLKIQRFASKDQDVLVIFYVSVIS